MLATALLYGALALPAPAQNPALSQADTDAKAMTAAAARLKVLHASLNQTADKLSAPLGPGALDLDQTSRELRTRVSALRGQSVDPAMDEALDALDAFYAQLPRRPYTRAYVGPLIEAAAEELRWAPGQAASPEELVAALKEDLILPADLSRSLSEGIPLAKWEKLGVVRRFLYKHRLKRPKHYVRASPKDLMDNKLNVEAGVELVGKAVGGHRAPEDKDWCFFIDGIEVEISPEWILTHPKLYLPKTGETVRVRGWTYYDNFHPDEVPRERPTLWEIHPAQDVELLAPAAPSAGTNP